MDYDDNNTNVSNINRKKQNDSFEPLYFTKYVDDELNVILRDLSINENLNVKNLFASYNDTKKLADIKKLSKREKIIAENIKHKQNKLVDSDKQRLEYYKKLDTLYPNILDEVKNFKTKYGKDKMKMKILDLAYKSGNKKLIINLFLQLLANSYDDKNDEKLMNKIKSILVKEDYKTFQFEHLSNELSPLDFYNDYEKKLDDWQINVLKNIDNNISTLVCAPTSCGKTWLSIYPGIMGKKVLFVVPTEALVYQVSSLFVKFGASVCILTGDDSYGSSSSNVIIGTPKDIEDKLPAIGLDFDIVIYDEIHNLDHKEFGSYYERLIKVLGNIKFLALSATIGDPHHLKNWLENITGDNVDLIIYTTRFLNLQRHIYKNNSQLHKIHPFSCLTIDDINSRFLNNNLPMTPYDCVSLYRSLNNKLGNQIEHLSVPNVFRDDNRRLSLDDSRYYENLLKSELIRLKETNEDDIRELIEEYNEPMETGFDINLYNLFKEIKKSKLTPCIVFQNNTQYCKEIFTRLVEYLENLEILNYPYHYDNLEFAQREYLASNEEKEKYRASIKFELENDENKQQKIEDLMAKKESQLLSQFLTKWAKNYERQQYSINNNAKISDKIRKIQLINLEKEYNKFTKNPSLRFIDIFAKHEDFCLNSNRPMSADKIRNIKFKIKSKTGIVVDYNNIFMQGLKRGIGIYTRDMPSVYNMIVQTLAQNGELGFVVADLTLALGINMPFRSTCILGYKDNLSFELHDYLQMIGRSGRRGLDNEGHIIYANVDWKLLMKGELKQINGDYRHIENYNVLSKINNNFSDNIVYTNILDPNAIIGDVHVDFYDEYIKNRLLWKLREYNSSIRFIIDNLVNLDIEYRCDINFSTMKKLSRLLGLVLIDNIQDVNIHNSNYNSPFTTYLVECFNRQKINEEHYCEFRKLKQFVIAIRDIHNILINDPNQYYMFFVRHLAAIFAFINRLFLSLNCLN